jgi:hypothetical protein
LAICAEIVHRVKSGQYPGGYLRAIEDSRFRLVSQSQIRANGSYYRLAQKEKISVVIGSNLTLW